MRMRAFSFFAIFVLFTLIVPTPGAAQMTMRGDVTEDGIVDGRDALKIMLVLEELMQAPDPGDIFWFLADVYPIPGTGGRIIGDGEVTREDAEKILRYVVGLIQLGEVTGDFAGPLVTDFEPRIGTPGTRVTLMGMNFVAGSMEENVVDFGGASAPVLSATATQIETEVPPDATTGPIRVRTPGGEAISKGEFVVTSGIAGQVELPEGLQPIDFTVVTSVGVGSLDAQGNFSAPGRDSSVTVLGAVPNAEGAENVFLALAIPGETDQGILQQDAKINARTTAETLIFCQPLFLTDNPTSLQILRDTMQNVPEIAQLEQLIEQKWPQDPNPLDAPEVQAALEAAIVAVDTALSAEEMGNMGEAIPEPALTSSMSTTELHHLDLKFLKPKIKNNSVIVDSEYGNPLDWLLMLVQVDPNDSDFDKWPELQNLNAVFDRLDKTKIYSIASARSWYGDWDLWDYGAKWLFEELGYPSHKPTLALTSEDEDAVYVLRMFSGALIDHSPNKSDSALLKALPGKKIGGYPTEIYEALSINVIMGVLDAVSIAIDLKGLLGEDVVAKVVKNMAIEFKQSFFVQFPEGFKEMTAENIEKTISGFKIVMADTYRAGFTTAGQELAKASAEKLPLKKLSGLAGFLVKTVDVVGKIGKGGKLYERMRALVGIEFLPFGLYGLLNYELFHGDVTPLESALIVVGEPFPPKIDNFEPKEGLAGEKIALTGRRFAKNAEDNQVRFGDQVAKVISVGEKFPGAGIPEIMEMVVEVPNGVPPGEVKISAMTSKGGPKFAPKMFKMLRSPEITKITPQSGFAATDDFMGTPFSGTRVDISGNYFDPQADPSDEVYCGSQKATIEEIYDGYIRLLVPAGVGQPGTEVEVKVIAPAVKSPTGKVSESNVISFALIGVPHIDRVSPTEAKVNARMVIEGSNFSPREDEIKVCFGESIDIRARSDYNYIETRMLISIEEGKEAQMTVVTPAGPSNAVTVKRLEGFASGASFTVREGLPPDPDYAEYITIERALLFAAGEGQPNDDEDYIEDPETGETISLDPPYEEEDQIHYWNEDKGFGKGYADSISVLGELNTNITLASHHDSLFVWGADITGKIELNANGCEILGTSLPGVTITGNENRIQVDNTIEGDVLIKGSNNFIGGGGLDYVDNIKGDVRIEGGRLNELRAHFSGGVVIVESMGNYLVGDIHGSDKDGVLITQGSANNECHLSCYDNDRDGFRIDGNSHENRIYIHTYDNKGNGGTITGGANNNSVSVSRASGNAGDGIRLEGDGTDCNRISVWPSWGVGDADSEDERDFRNEGYGIAIVDGPKDNTVTGGPIGASKRGGICISNASSVTLSYSTSIAIPAIGQSLSMPGILLENGARNILIDALINWRLPGALENGIVIRGSETSNIEMSVIMMGSLHITDGAHDIRVIQSWFVDSKNAGILIDKEAHHVELIDNDIVASTGDGIIIDGAHDNLLTSSTSESVLDPYTDIIDNQGNGVIIRNGAQRNIVRWQFISNNQDGIVVSGAEDTVIEGCHLRENNGDGILVTAQAMNTTVGGLHENQSNFISENDNAGIRVSGGANGVKINNNMIHGYFDEPNQVTGDWGIVVEGQSQNVSIGSEQLTGWNEIAKHEQGGILIADKGTQGVSMVNNYIGIQHTGEVAGNNGPGVMVTNEAGPEIFIDQNFISGNQDAGIVFDVDGMYSNMVEDTPNIKDNIIGLDPTGKNNVPNNVGIRLTGTRIGVVRNTISGNLQDGISIESGAHHNIIDRNTISDNGRHGVFITENSISNPLFGNTITGNGQKGIALENGGNQMIEAPVIEAITPDGRIVGKILAPDVVSVEVYRDRDDEGEFYVGPGIMNKTRNRFYIKAPIPQGWKVHAIVTDENRNTSEFGPMLSSSPWTLCPAVIAFTSTRDGDMEVYMFENRQDQAERITKQNGPDHSPKVSPDLSAIAFVSERSGQPDIWLYERATEEQLALTEDPAPDYDPAWSPDGSEIAFVSERDGNPEIYVVGADGQNLTRLTNNPASDRYPCWSPNGEKIAFTSERSGNQDIWVMDADGSNPVCITDHVAADYRPNWSASRNLIAFISERDQQLKVWAAEPDGSNPRLLTPGACLDSDPAWTPEGRLLFASDRDGDWEVWVLDLDGRVWRLTVSLGSNIEPDGQFYLYGEEPDI